MIRLEVLLCVRFLLFLFFSSASFAAFMFGSSTPRVRSRLLTPPYTFPAAVARHIASVQAMEQRDRRDARHGRAEDVVATSRQVSHEDDESR